ncbi:hypothetical protein [Wolbachia endosymbiont of Tribolium confusum]|uniref:hypothetical protein n=1 Tax=Wolbachia endosymbiont of Tribolium confusum TaxID=214474 RepID=UPI001CF47B49|nr:hypothetical protein [Wolbachia endosymbiont of Tribolium confusum]MCA7010879.1 hypothetical protein [Wolbachia endosymbiont of Tribolium confusum]
MAKSCLTEGGKIAQRTKEDIQKELLDNAKLLHLIYAFYYDNHTHQYGRSFSPKPNLMRFKRKPQKKHSSRPG